MSGWPLTTIATVEGPTMPRCSNDRLRSRQATKLAGAITLRAAPPVLVSHTADDPIGLVIRQRLEHHAAHDAEDRGGRADAERQAQEEPEW